MAYLGLDLGTKTLGIAISKTGLIAQGYEEFIFEEENYDKAIEEVLRIIEKEGIDKICLGLPLNMNGSESKMSGICREFKQKLEERCNIKVDLVDERMTSMLANRILIEHDISRAKRKKVVDKLAAQTILETYLNGGN
ncbi:MAG: Holliday junction resolvase RuvX [Firmicutes bacterium]|uniref:Putative pre-16S rRNA nuclease n=1 Tax=Candidatus Scatoplasma merdavium TaxID=2840932 RepID=A0A9D9GSN3_9BACL|nr:Holliday junction resolvase RuvX [Candidatus Scatoplasma merdavium]